MKPLEQRIHSRFKVGDYRCARVRFGDGPFYFIRDLSFSGFSVHSHAEPVGDQVVFEFFDLSVTTAVSLVYRTDEICGYQFLHRNPAMLIFLQPFLERLRNGSTMKKIASEHLKDELREGNWIVMHGDGPCSLKMKVEVGHHCVESLLLTFLDDGHYHELRFKDGTFRSGRQLDETGVATRMSSDDSLDPAALRFGLTILAGIEDEGVARLLLPIVLLGSDFCKAGPVA